MPLKVGILYDILVWLDENKESVGEEIREERPTRTAIRDALTFYTNNKWYQQALVEHDKRYDLDGFAVDDVPDVHKTYATERHSKIEEKIKAQNEKRKVYHAKKKARKAEKADKVDVSEIPIIEDASVHHEDTPVES